MDLMNLENAYNNIAGCLAEQSIQALAKICRKRHPEGAGSIPDAQFEGLMKDVVNIAAEIFDENVRIELFGKPTNPCGEIFSEWRPVTLYMEEHERSKADILKYNV